MGLGTDDTQNGLNSLEWMEIKIREKEGMEVGGLKLMEGREGWARSSGVGQKDFHREGHLMCKGWT